MIYTYKIKGMTCNGCSKSVKQKLQDLIPEASINISLNDSNVTIESKSEPNLDELQKHLPQKYTLSKFIAKEEGKVLAVKNSKWKALKPLFLIFIYIILGSVLMHISHWDTKEFMLDFMGLFFIVFSFFKFLDLKGFKSSFKMYDPLAGVFPLYGFIYPFIELILGIALLLRFQVFVIAMVTVFLLTITTIGVTKVLLDKKDIQCACLGTVLKLPMTQATFIENTIMIIMGVFVII